MRATDRVTLRPVWAEVDLAAIRHNVGVLAAPGRPRPAVRGGQGRRLRARAGGVGPGRARRRGRRGWPWPWWRRGRSCGTPGSTRRCSCSPSRRPRPWPTWSACGLTATVYTEAGVAAAAAAAAAAATPLPVHVKVDTGMHRVGAAPADAVKLALTVEERPELDSQARVDPLRGGRRPRRPLHRVQQPAASTAVLDELAGLGVRPPLAHACNSAGALAHPDARHDLVRCGLAVYGVAPSPALAGRRRDLRPALALKARVSLVKEVDAGRGRLLRPPVPGRAADDRGHRPHRLRRRRPLAARRARAARSSSAAGGGRIAGAVTMDQLMVDCGDDAVGGGGRRGRAPRPPGRRGDRRLGVGRAAGHHRLRGAERHRRPRAPRVHR